MHRILLTAFFFLLAITTSAQKDSLKWFTDFEKAKKISEKNDQPILMYFTGSDWCVPCKMLQEDFFSTDKFKQQSTKVVLLKVDIPRRMDVISEKQLQKNKILLKEYNKSGGFPHIIAINHKGKILGEEGSYSASLRDPSRYYNFLDTIVKNY